MSRPESGQARDYVPHLREPRRGTREPPSNGCLQPQWFPGRLRWVRLPPPGAETTLTVAEELLNEASDPFRRTRDIPKSVWGSPKGPIWTQLRDRGEDRALPLSRPRVSGPARNSRDWSPDSRDGPRHPGRVAPRRPTGLDAWAGAPRNGPSCEPALSLSASPSLKVGGEDLKAPGDKDGHDKTHECQQQHFHFVVSSAGGDMLGEQGTPSRSERLPAWLPRGACGRMPRPTGRGLSYRAASWVSGFRTHRQIPSGAGTMLSPASRAKSAATA
jgi:hypothetical protein